MKKMLLVTAVSALVIAGCQSNSLTPAQIEATPQLAAAISAFTKDDSTRYEVAYADLNKNGIQDGIVLLEGMDWCGSGGCTMLVFEGLEGGDFKLKSTSTVVSAPIYILEKSTGGWSDLSVYSRGKGQVMMKWGGSNYPSNPSLQPTLVIDSKEVKPAISPINIP